MQSVTQTDWVLAQSWSSASTGTKELCSHWHPFGLGPSPKLELRSHWSSVPKAGEFAISPLLAMEERALRISLVVKPPSFVSSTRCEPTSSPILEWALAQGTGALLPLAPWPCSRNPKRLVTLTTSSSSLSPSPHNFCLFPPAAGRRCF